MPYLQLVNSIETCPQGQQKQNKIQDPPGTNNGHFYSCNHEKWFPYQFPGGKTVQIDPQPTECGSKS